MHGQALIWLDSTAVARKGLLVGSLPPGCLFEKLRVGVSGQSSCLPCIIHGSFGSGLHDRVERRLFPRCGFRRTGRVWDPSRRDPARKGGELQLWR